MNIAQKQSKGGEESQQRSTESGAATATAMGGKPVDNRIAMSIQPVEVRLNVATDCSVQVAVDIVRAIGVHLLNKSIELQVR